ncbi:MAG: type II secretion system F family protein [Burkholderiaceae bacterium]|nr:type II secretion system F family protein [Burkholderiaceae bacterium]
MQTLIYGLLFVSSVFLAGSIMLFWQDMVATRSDRASVLQTSIGVSEAALQSNVYRDLRVSAISWLDQLIRTNPRIQGIQHAIARSGVRLYVDQVIAIGTCLSVAIAAILWFFHSPWLLILPSAGLAFISPWLVLRYRRRKRLQVIEEQLPDALDAISRAMQAGNSLAGALSTVGKESPDPLGRELRMVSDEINFGRSVKEGLAEFSLRLGSLDIRYFVLAVLIHSQTGGNLSSLLSGLATLIRERLRLKRRIRVLSAEGRLSGWVLTLLPFIAGFLVYLMNPDFMRILWATPAGMLLLQINAALMMVGLFWMWKIIHFRI